MEGLLKKMTKQAYHLEERLLKKPNISSFHFSLPPAEHLTPSVLYNMLSDKGH